MSFTVREIFSPQLLEMGNTAVLVEETMVFGVGPLGWLQRLRVPGLGLLYQTAPGSLAVSPLAIDDGDICR